MTFSSYKIDKILPDNKEKFENYESFKKKIDSNIRYLQFRELEEGEMSDLFKLLYEMDDKDYVLFRKKVKMEYSMFRKNSDIVQDVIVNEEDYIAVLNNMIEAYKIKGSVVNRMVSQLIPADANVEFIQKVLEDVASTDSVEVEVTIGQLLDRTSELQDNPYVEEYINREKVALQGELVSLIQGRLSRKLNQTEMISDSALASIKIACIKKSSHYRR